MKFNSNTCFHSIVSSFLIQSKTQEHRTSNMMLQKFKRLLPPWHNQWIANFQSLSLSLFSDFTYGGKCLFTQPRMILPKIIIKCVILDFVFGFHFTRWFFIFSLFFYWTRLSIVQHYKLYQLSHQFITHSHVATIKVYLTLNHHNFNIFMNETRGEYSAISSSSWIFRMFNTDG